MQQYNLQLYDVYRISLSDSHSAIFIQSLMLGTVNSIHNLIILILVIIPLYAWLATGQVYVVDLQWLYLVVGHLMLHVVDKYN